MSEQIGKHKGAVETLLHEQKELSRILGIVNSQLERHLRALEESGIDTEEFLESVRSESDENATNSKNSESAKSSEANQDFSPL